MKRVMTVLAIALMAVITLSTAATAGTAKPLTIQNASVVGETTKVKTVALSVKTNACTTGAKARVLGYSGGVTTVQATATGTVRRMNRLCRVQTRHILVMLDVPVATVKIVDGTNNKTLEEPTAGARGAYL